MHGRFSTFLVAVVLVGASTALIPGLWQEAAAAPASSVTRTIQGEQVCGGTLEVTLDITWDDAQILAIEETYPENWKVEDIERGGKSNEPGKVKWFIFDNTAEKVGYTLKIPAGTMTDTSLSGTFRDDTMESEEPNAVIQGDRDLNVSCSPEKAGSVVRTLPTDVRCGERINISLAIVPAEGTDAWILDEDPPIPPSSVDERDHGDSVQGRVKWVSTDGEGGTRSYTLDIPVNTSDGSVYIFRGEYRFNPSMDDRARVDGDKQIVVGCTEEDRAKARDRASSQQGDQANTTNGSEHLEPSSQDELAPPTRTAQAEPAEATGPVKARFTAQLTAAAGEGITVTFQDPVLSSLDFYPATDLEEATLTVSRWGWEAPPEDPGALPQGVESAGYLEISLPRGVQADGHTAVLKLTLPADEVLDAERLILLRWEDTSAWRATARVDVQQGSGDTVIATARTACCSYFALAYDLSPPSLDIQLDGVGEDQVLTAEASDNVGVDRVELHVDGELADVDREAPHTFSLADLGLAPGSHALEVVAVDSAGATTSATTTATIGAAGGLGATSYAMVALLLVGLLGVGLYTTRRAPAARPGAMELAVPGPGGERTVRIRLEEVGEEPVEATDGDAPSWREATATLLTKLDPRA